MKIGIDARNYFSNNKSGVDYYVASLVDGIIKHDKTNQFYFFVDARAKKKTLPINIKNMNIVKVPFNKNYLKAIDLAAKFLRLDFVHYTSGGSPNKTKVPYVMTIYDLTFEMHPEFYASVDLAKQKNTEAHAKGALGIISISESTKRDLVKKYLIDSNKIVVTHLAFNKPVLKPKNTKTKDYLLFVGNLQPRKNLTKILEALALIELSKRPKLFVAGNIQDKNELARLNEFIIKHNLKDSVFLMGYVSEKELDKLYAECLGVIYPSIYEGFGYNILEAFYYKKPLITSKISSMPEIAKDAAVYVDPKSSNSIKEAIERIVNDKTNNSIITGKGSNILKEYTIEKMIKKTLKAYEKFGSKK